MWPRVWARGDSGPLSAGIQAAGVHRAIDGGTIDLTPYQTPGACSPFGSGQTGASWAGDVGCFSLAGAQQAMLYDPSSGWSP